MKMLVRCLFISTLLLSSMSGQAHTLYVKPELSDHTVNQDSGLLLVNGTYWTNESPVPERQFSKTVIIDPAGASSEPDHSQWRSENGPAKLDVNFSLPGTYVVGVALKQRQVRMGPEDFNEYLRYEGLLDDAKERAERDEQELRAAERYTKHAKTIIQVDDHVTNNYSEVLGHPIEIIPLVNPAELRAGALFRAQVLKGGQPLVGELVYANTERMNETTDDGIFKELVSVRSGIDGIIEFEVSEAGSWYVRLVHLARLGDSEHWYSDLLVWLGLDDPRIPYESHWATLTFEIQ